MAKDIDKIVQHLHTKQVFRIFPGRQHMHVGRISADPLTDLNMSQIHAWMKKSTIKFRNKHYYT